MLNSSFLVQAMNIELINGSTKGNLVQFICITKKITNKYIRLFVFLSSCYMEYINERSFFILSFCLFIFRLLDRCFIKENGNGFDFSLVVYPIEIINVKTQSFVDSIHIRTVSS